MSTTEEEDASVYYIWWLPILTYPFSLENCVFERDVAVSFLVPVAEDASSGHKSLNLRHKVKL